MLVNLDFDFAIQVTEFTINCFLCWLAARIADLTFILIDFSGITSIFYFIKR